MSFIKSALFRSFTIGFVIGGVGVCLALGISEGKIGTMVPQAIAATMR
ncbi:MAG TPA: hypothetical protein VN222_13425 [Novosphingobium sp.]|nr:hypothetical protein [Novosphingobium sp.]